MPRERDWDAIKQAVQDLDFLNEQIEKRTKHISTMANDLDKIRQMQGSARRKLESLLHGTMPSDATASPSSNVEDS